MNNSGSDESKPSSDAPAETTHPPLSALDLANLAANLNPALCNSDPEAAFLNAIAYYEWAAHFVKSNAARSLIEIYNHSAVSVLKNVPLMQTAIEKALPSFTEWKRGGIEMEELRFYPKRPTDDVRALLNVTTERGVKNQLERWFVARAQNDARSAREGPQNDARIVREGRREFKEFWKDARTDEAGEKYYAISRDRLEGVRKFEASRRSSHSKKAAQSRRAK